MIKQDLNLILFYRVGFFSISALHFDSILSIESSNNKFNEILHDQMGALFWINYRQITENGRIWLKWRQLIHQIELIFEH